jgi:hypothetical protein
MQNWRSKRLLLQRTPRRQRKSKARIFYAEIAENTKRKKRGIETQSLALETVIETTIEAQKRKEAWPPFFAPSVFFTVN